MLSTHIMQEVEAICSRVVIINKGLIVADGSIEQLKTGQFAKNQEIYIEFDQTPDLNAFGKLSGIQKIEKINPTTFIIESVKNTDLRPAIFKFAVDNQLVLLTLKEMQQSLENVFQDLTR
jgi:ABC-2 type transport system ATP-binding protein